MSSATENAWCVVESSSWKGLEEYMWNPILLMSNRSVFTFLLMDYAIHSALNILPYIFIVCLWLFLTSTSPTYITWMSFCSRSLEEHRSHHGLPQKFLPGCQSRPASSTLSKVMSNFYLRVGTTPSVNVLSKPLWHKPGTRILVSR